MTTPYTTSEEEYLDDDLLDKLDPYANAHDGTSKQVPKKESLTNSY